MLKQFIWQEVLSGFNEEVVISNKPTALYQALNADMEKQPGSLRKRKGYKIFGSQIVDGNDVLGLFDFIQSSGTRVPLAVIDDTVAITGAAYSDPSVTLTVASGHGIVAGDTIVVSGLAPTTYNGTFEVDSVTATEIVYSSAGLAALTTTTGTITFSKIMYYDSGWTLSKKGFTPSVKGRFETFVGYVFFTNGEELKTSSDGQTWGTTNLLNTIEITDVSYSDPTVTLTVNSGHGVVVGDEIVVSGLVPNEYNGTVTVTTVTTSTISYSSAGLGTSQVVAITNASYSDPTVTLTVASGHGVAVGDEITVAGLAPAEYNGTYTVTAVDTTEIEYEEAGAAALTTTTGNILVTIDADLTVQFSLPANDVVKYANYLFLVGIEGYRSDIMWSNVPYKNDSGDYVLDWNRNNNVSISLGDGEELLAGQEYRGAFYIFKNSSIARTIAPVASNGIKMLSTNIGANSKDCIQVVSGQMVFFNDGKRNSKKGFYSFNSLSDAEPQIISEPIQPYIDGMTAGQTVVAGVINDLYIAYVGTVTNREHNISITNCYLVFNAKTNRWLGAWSFANPAKIMSLLTISNKTKLYFGDNDGVVWETDEGNRDGYVDAETPGTQIVLDVISHPYDITRGGKGYRESYMKRAMKELYLVGDRLDNCKLRYRFDKRLSEKGAWETVSGMKNPVHKAPFKRTDIHLFQYRITHNGEQNNEPIIRKLIIEHE